MHAFLHLSLHPRPARQRADPDRERPLTAHLLKQLRRQFADLDEARVSGYTFRSHNSRYPDAISDLFIYDDAGRLVILGREFAGTTALWTAPPAEQPPAWHAYIPPRHGRPL